MSDVDDVNLQSRIAVVTGGASGIGAATARALGARGARVVVADVTDAAEMVAREIGGSAFHADVGDEAAVEALAHRVETEVGPVAILVNSAGIIQRPVAPQDLPMKDWDDVVRVDQRGTWLTSLAFGRRMAARGAGAIVNIASIAGMRSMPLHAYAPAKAAVISMTECLAAEWGPSGVRVNAVSPGYTLTPALQRAIAFIDAHAESRIRLADIVAAAGIGARALQYDFLRHHQITPLGYLRRVRLERAHRDLLAADPAGGATVSAIAARWGFAKTGRFAEQYRAAYGRLPSQTLSA